MRGRGDGKRGWTGLKPEDVDIRRVPSTLPKVMRLALREGGEKSRNQDYGMRGASRERRIGDLQLMLLRVEEMENQKLSWQTALSRQRRFSRRLLFPPLMTIGRFSENELERGA